MDNMACVFWILLAISFNCGITFKCEKTETCAENRNQNIPLCYCDEDCLHYRDCCKEYVSNQKVDSDNENSTRQHCVLLTNEKYLVGERVGAFMTDSCNGSSVPCSLKDTDLKSAMPVSSEDKTYINDECALCNGVSTFRYWTAVFGDIDENMLFKQSRENLSVVDARQFLINEGTSSQGLVVFHPPINFRPRFCPYDILLAEKVQRRKTFHQNPFQCNNVFFKNEDVCKAEGCCNADDDVWCIGFTLPYYRAEHINRGDGFGIQLTLNFGTFDSTQDPSKKTDEKRESMTFEDMKVHVIFNFYIERNGINGSHLEFDDCVQGMLLLLASYPFYLKSISGTYNVFIIGNGTVVTLHHLQSHASMNLTLINKLIRLKFSFACQTRVKATFLGNVKVEKAEDVQNHFRSMDYDKAIDGAKVELNKFILADPEAARICDNMALDFENKISLTIVHIRCDDDTEANTNVNGAILPGSNMATFTFLSFVVILTFLSETITS